MTTHTYERRTFGGEVELREVGNSLVARGYAALFDTRSQDLGGFTEVIAPTAFTKTVAEADVRALFNHDPAWILGRNRAGTLRLWVDERGLPYEIDMPNTTQGRDVAELLRRRDVTGSSFGFRVVGPNGDSWEQDDDGRLLRTLHEVALRDVGPVVFPAYTDTEAALRSLEDRGLMLPERLTLGATAATEPAPVELVTAAPIRRRRIVL